MPDHARSFWQRLEMLVMAAACGTLLGTGLLAGVISFGSGEVAAFPAERDTDVALFGQDQSGAYSALVIVDGVPLWMIVDTGAAQSSLSAQDAKLLPRLEDNMAGYRAQTVDIAGHSLREQRLEISPTSNQSVIGLNWLAQLGPIMLAPAPKDN